MPIRRALIVLLCALCLPIVALAAPSFLSVPDLIRPGQYNEIVFRAPEDGRASLMLIDGGRNTPVMSAFPILEGENTTSWDGSLADGSVAAPGEYILQLTLPDGTHTHQSVRIGEALPRLTDVTQTAGVLGLDGPITVGFTASETGTLQIDLFRYGVNSLVKRTSVEVGAGASNFQWWGTIDGRRVEAGDYALILSLESARGELSFSQYVFITVEPETPSVLVPVATLPPSIARPSPETGISPSYSDIKDGSFWAMRPGELDDAVIWDVMMQPITVYDDGKIRASGHVYMMENPDGSGARVAQIHGLSQGLHVIGEPNEYGYVLVEAFSNYDLSFYPRSHAAMEEAFELKQGYLLADNLKLMAVQPDIGLLVDKLTQRMYVFIDGKRVTEMYISTGLGTYERMYRETIPGEFITISHTGGYWSNGLYSDLAIRVNGGTLIHEVPCTINEEGRKYYGVFARYLGQKASAGCIRVQYWKNPEGFNQKWLWDNLKTMGRYKVLIWDDRNRYDTPSTWR